MSFDGDAHETRRNALLGVGLSVVAVVLVGAMFWVMSSLSRPAVTGTAAVSRTTTATGSPSAAAAPSPTTTTDTLAPLGSWTNTVTLPPPEQPTMTAPVAGQTVDAPPAPATSAPVKTTQAAPPPPPPPPPPAPPAPTVTNVKLTCKKEDKKVTATLTFSTTTRVDVVLAPGGMAQRSQQGPGDVSLTASARGADLCYAQVAGQMVGPVPAT